MSLLKGFVWKCEIVGKKKKKNETAEADILKFGGDAPLRKEISSGGFASSAPSWGLKEVNTQQTKVHTRTHCGNKSQHMQNLFIRSSSFIYNLQAIFDFYMNNK